MKLNPPEFVMEWLKKLNDIFEVMEVTEEHKLSLATFMLKGEAWNWWEAMRRMMTAHPGGVPITWQQFMEIFNDQYFPCIYCT